MWIMRVVRNLRLSSRAGFLEFWSVGVFYCYEALSFMFFFNLLFFTFTFITSTLIWGK